MLATVNEAVIDWSAALRVTTGALGTALGPTVVTSEATLAPAELIARTTIGYVVPFAIWVVPLLEIVVIISWPALTEAVPRSCHRRCCTATT